MELEKKILRDFKRYLMSDEYVKENDLTNPFGNLIAMFRKGYLLGKGKGINLPNNIYVEELQELLKYSNRYEISIQFWPDQIAVYIAKGGVDLYDTGGDFAFAVKNATDYLNRINGNENDKAS